MKYLLGLDEGTTGCKAVVFDLSGNVIGEDYREYPCYFPNPGWVEQRDDEITEGLYASVRSAIEKSKVDPKDIVSMAISTQGGVWGPLDKDGKLLRPFMGWQDARGIKYAEKIRKNEIINADLYYKISGYSIGTVLAGTKILWFKDEEPEIAAKTAMFSTNQDFFTRAFGATEYWTDTASAQRLGVFDVDNRVWSKEIFEAFGLDEAKFAKIGRGGQVVGKVSKAVSEITKLAEGTLICLGAHDQNCSTIGAGLVNDGDAVLVMGTYGSIFVGSDKAVRDPNKILMVKSNVGPETFTMEAASSTAASSYRWYRDTFSSLEKALAPGMNVDPYELINAQIALVPPGANGVTFLPYLAGADGGARGDSYARGAFLGLTLATSKREIARAVMEGITFEMKDNFEAQKKAGVNIKEVRLTGGATKSKLWNQMQADIYGVPVKLLQTSETGCLGAAIYAGIGAGLFKTYNEAVEKVVHVKETYTPNPENVKAYEKAFGLFQSAYDSLSKGGYFKKSHE